MSLLEATGLCKSYPLEGSGWNQHHRFKALDGISFKLNDGESLGVIGESGSGKSTLGRLILGLEKPDSGSVVFLGTEMHKCSDKRMHTLRRNMQAVFQDCHHALNPRMYAGAIIGEPLRNYERLSPLEMKRIQGELLETVGLSAAGDMDKYPHQFSGGQQQRLNIARALALRPKLIVLDEAVSSLDMMIQAQILGLLSDLKERFGLSYLFITHDLQAACSICDRFIVMDRGQIAEKCEDISKTESLRHPASRKLLDAQLASHPGERTIGRQTLRI